MYDRINEILEYAQELFDTVGAVDNFLILGLESRKNRDLDQFMVKDGKYRFPGFAKYFSPKINVLVKKIREHGFKANQLKYSEINIKQLAVKAGLGKWGKNSLVIHHKFGPWLRFVVIESDFPFATQTSRELRTIYGECHNCSRCIKACPTMVIDDFRVLQPQKCIAYLQLGNPNAFGRRCDICLEACKPQRP